VTKKIISNGHTDPLHDIQSKPDVVLLHYIPGYGELEHMAEAALSKRLPLIVLGPADDPEAMRLAIRAGASDYISRPLQQVELLNALERIGEQLKDKETGRGQLVTVMNSKGGSGASFVATNLAYALKREKNTSSVLVDLDLQFGGLSRYLDIYPKRGLVEALDVVEEMDEVSAEAYITKHNSGLRLLAAPTERLVLSRDIPVEHVDGLLQVLLSNNDYVVADLPRRIDVLTATVLEHSDQILLLVQQSLTHIHDAARMIKLITNELAVPMNRIRIIVNRYSKNSLIETSDITGALKIDQLNVIPNQYKLVSESIDSGVPLMHSSKNSAAGKAIERLLHSVCGTDEEKPASRILDRVLPSFLSKN
jgi:pilus assembly protein CpaE